MFRNHQVSHQAKEFATYSIGIAAIMIAVLILSFLIRATFDFLSAPWEPDRIERLLGSCSSEYSREILFDKDKLPYLSAEAAKNDRFLHVTYLGKFLKAEEIKDDPYYVKVSLDTDKSIVVVKGLDMDANNALYLISASGYCRSGPRVCSTKDDRCSVFK